MNWLLSILYDIAEFVAFIVPRGIQVFLDGLAQLGFIEGALAMSIYVGLSYVSAAGLVFYAVYVGQRMVHGQMLVLNAHTANALAGSLVLVALAGFTAAAPTTGLSLKECTAAAAEFVKFD